MFGFQKLDVYRCSVAFLALAATLVERAPRGYSALADQLRRAALSFPLNIAEGRGKGTMEESEARRFYAIARGRHGGPTSLGSQPTASGSFPR